MTYLMEMTLASEAGIDDARQGLPINERNMRRAPRLGDNLNRALWNLYREAYNNEAAK